MTSGSRVAHRSGAQGPSTRVIVLGVLLASTSGAAILAHTFGPVPMRVLVPFVVLPGALVLTGMVYASRKRYPELELFADRAISGILWGLIATLAYDAIRPPLVWAFQYDFNPYKAMPIFGHLITGRPEDDTIAQVVGWGYHFWNGLSFGLMLALMRPRGGPIAGFVWAMILQGFMMAAYPSFLDARLDNPGFLMTGIVGHGIWGLVLGEGLRRWGRG